VGWDGNGSSDYLQVSAAPGTVPFVMACWMKADNVTATGVTMASCVAGASDQGRFQLIVAGATGGDPIQAGSTDSGGTAVAAATSTSYTAATWCHVCALFVSTTDRRVLRNAGGKGTNTGSNTVGTRTLTNLGTRTSTTGSRAAFFPGILAEAAIWNLSAYPGATAADKADYFEANVLPSLIADAPSLWATGLAAYWSLLSNGNDAIASNHLTNNGGIFVVDHPTLSYPASGQKVPVKTASYRRRRG
jgi:hypothetical protein